MRRFVDTDLARLIKPPRVQPRREPVLASDEVERLLATCQTSRDVAILLVLFDTGIRAGEMCALTVRNMDFGTRTLTVPRGKSGGRTVPIGRATARALRRWLVAHPAPTPDAPLFPKLLHGRGEPLTLSTLQAILDRLGKRANIRQHPHQWRHSFAVTYLRNGGDVFSLQRILGHSTLDMSRWYAELADADVAARHVLASPADRLKRH